MPVDVAERLLPDLIQGILDGMRERLAPLDRDGQFQAEALSPSASLMEPSSQDTSLWDFFNWAELLNRAHDAM